MKNKRKRCSPERGENRAATSRYLYMYVGEERIVLPSIPRCLLSLPQFYPSSPPIIRTATSHPFPSLPAISMPPLVPSQNTHTRALAISIPWGDDKKKATKKERSARHGLAKKKKGRGGSSEGKEIHRLHMEQQQGTRTSRWERLYAKFRHFGDGRVESRRCGWCMCVCKPLGFEEGVNQRK